MAVSLTISAVDHTTGQLTITAHGLATGAGPATLFAGAGGVIPTGLAAMTNVYAIVVDANTIKLADSSAHALSNTPLSFTDNGTLPLSLLLGIPYRRGHTYVPNSGPPGSPTPGSQLYSADLNDEQDALTAIWNMLTGQSRSLFPLLKPYADALTFETPVNRTLNPIDSTDNIGGAPGISHSRSRYGWTFAASVTPIWYALNKLQPGDVITNLSADVNKNTSSGAVKIEIIHTTSSGDFIDSGTTFTSGTGTIGLISLGGAVSLTIANGLAYYVRVTPGGSATPSADQIGDVVISFKRPHP